MFCLAYEPIGGRRLLARYPFDAKRLVEVALLKLLFAPGPIFLGWSLLCGERRVGLFRLKPLRA
jgi:hypothetical protein